MVVFGWSGSVRGLWAEWEMFFQGGFLVQGGVAHVFIDGVYCHLSDVLRCLTEKKLTINMTVVSHCPWTQSYEMQDFVR